MRLKHITMAMAAAFLLAACSKEEFEIPQKPETGNVPEEKPEEPEAEGIPLSFDVSCLTRQDISDVTTSRSGVVNQFVPGHEIEIFTGADSYKYVYNGTAWKAEQQITVNGIMDLKAVFPYSGKAKESELTIDITKQQDVMWASAQVSENAPSTVFNMFHMLSLVRIKLVKDEYTGKGQVSDVKIHDSYIDPIINVSTGKLYKGKTKGVIELDDNYIIGEDPQNATEVIVSPKNWGDKVYMTFNLDGKEVRYTFPETDTWEGGLKYTYTIKLRGREDQEIYKEDVPVDVEFWNKYGKDDRIVIEEKSYDDDENFFTVSVRRKRWGYAVHQNEATILHFNYTHFGQKPFDGKVRAVLTKDGKIVDQFHPIEHNKKEKLPVFLCQAYITADPGVYKIDLLFQRNGESTWFHGMDEGEPEEYTIKVLPPAGPMKPALRELYLEDHEGESFDLIYDIPDHDPFNVVAVISNKEKRNIRGTLRAVWGREFNIEGNSEFPSDKQESFKDDPEWEDVIGEKVIEIPEGVKFWKTMISCKVTASHPTPKYKWSYIHLYWKGENDTEWTLVRMDGDYLLNRNFKGYIFDEVTNNIKTVLESWF